MLLEDIRLTQEDLERLEQGISDRIAEDPKHVRLADKARKFKLTGPVQIRDRLARDHQIANFLQRIQEQSKHLKELYDSTEARNQEIQSISTGDPFDKFYKELNEIKTFHRKYPNEPVENLEKAYKRRPPTEGESATPEVDNMFTGEEAWGRFMDLTSLHEDYLNLPGVKRLTYLQYLDTFFIFTPPQCPIKREGKQTDKYFNYVGRLASYLEGFMRRIRPLEDVDKTFAAFDREFDRLWEANGLPAWQAEGPLGPLAPENEEVESLFCADCGKDFKNENVYNAHLTGKKHLKAVQSRKPSQRGSNLPGRGSSAQRLKERAIAEREYRVSSLASALSSIRSATRINVERRQGMTERERQQELEALFAESNDYIPAGDGDSDESDSEEKIYNPLKLPLAWDGKPIPYWLYKLHGLGVEFSCEICGNFVYMGRRAFDKHFSEARHIYGLKCLGVTNTTLFRDITGIDDALKLWDKLQKDKKVEVTKQDVVQMEDAEGNVMPEKVYYDLQKQGLL